MCDAAQRKETLLFEFAQKNKSNAFIDRRIGEKDENISKEEKMHQRWLKERQVRLAHALLRTCVMLLCSCILYLLMFAEREPRFGLVQS